MSDQYIPHPAKNFTPRANPPRNALESATRHVEPVDVGDLPALRKLARKELVSIIQGNDGASVKVAAIKELLDRIDGKPHQSIDMNAQVKLRYEPLVIKLAQPEPIDVTPSLEG
jgi:hypothetical protein